MSELNRSSEGLETDLISLRAFVAVVDEGTFSAAAEQIGRTQSAVSLQIAKLEQRLAVKLFERSTRSISLTSAGETFLSYARRIVETADEAFLAVSSPSDEMRLRVGFAEYLAPQHLHTLLARFRRAHPRCDLRLVLGLGAEMLASMDRGELDVVIAGPESKEGTTLWTEPLVWTAGEDFKRDDATPIELILMPHPCGYRQIAFDALTATSLTWKISIEANSVQAVQSSVRAGLGVSILPVSAVTKGLTVIRNLPKLPTTSVISYLGKAANNTYTNRLIEYLVKSLTDPSH